MYAQPNQTKRQDQGNLIFDGTPHLPKGWGRVLLKSNTSTHRRSDDREKEG